MVGVKTTARITKRVAPGRSSPLPLHNVPRMNQSVSEVASQGWVPGRLRPLRVSELIAATLLVYRRNITLMLVLGGVISIVGEAVVQIVAQIVDLNAKLTSMQHIQSLITNNTPLTASDVAASNDALLAIGIVLVVTAATQFFVTVYGQGAVALVVTGLANGQRLQARSVYRALFTRGGSLLAIALLLFVIVSVPMALALVATVVAKGMVIVWLSLIVLVMLGFAFVVILYFVVAPPAIMCEEIGAADALHRSWHLVQKLALRSVGVIMVATIIGIVVRQLFAIVAELVTSMGNNVLTQGASLAIDLVAAAVTAPIGFIAVALLYYDLRVRKGDATIPLPGSLSEA